MCACGVYGWFYKCVHVVPGWVCKCVHVVSVSGLQMCACGVYGWVCKCVHVVSVGGLQVCECGVNGWVCKCVHVCGWVGGLVTSDSIFSPASFSCLYFFPSVTKTNIQCLTLQFTCFKQV